LDIFLVRFDSAGQHQWSKRFGNSSTDVGDGVATDQSGNIVITGHYSGSVDFEGSVLHGYGSTDIFVVRFDRNGQRMWARRAGGSQFDFGNRVAISPLNGDVWVVGAFTTLAMFESQQLISNGLRDAFVARYSSTGQHLWAKNYGTYDQDTAEDITVDGSGNVAVIGTFEGTADFGGGPLTSQRDDVFILRLDPGAAFLWAGAYGGSSTDYGRGIAADARGAIIACGNYQSFASFGGTPFNSKGITDVFLLKLAP
jgi:hypothetical protein